MGDQMHAARSGAAWRLVRAQHGVVSRGQLLELGFVDKAIKHRVATGRLHPLMAGVYAVGRRDLSPHGRWMAAVLACGDRAALSHRSAAELWGIGREWDHRIDVSIRRKGKIARKGIKVRARPSLGAGNITTRRGIPVTSPVQTIIDLATELEDRRLERAVNEADVLDLVDPETLRRSLGAHFGEPGVKRLRTMLDRHTFRLSDSDLEILFRPLARAAAFPAPMTKQMVLGYEVDFHFPDHDLIVETDGLRYHRTPASQARAAKRDQTHTAAGYSVLRFTHWQIAHAPTEVTDVLRRFRLRPQPARVADGIALPASRP